jgi:hypothetical protein
MKGKIIFIVHETFSKRDYERYKIQLLEKKGYVLEIWDICTLFKKNYVNNYTPSDVYTGKKLFSFFELFQLKSALDDLTSTEIVVCRIPYIFEYRVIFQYLSKKKIHYGFILLNHIPSVKEQNKKTFRLKQLFSDISVGKIANFIFRKFDPKYFNIAMPSFLIVGGKKSIGHTKYPIGPNTKFIWAHAFDYDIFLENKKLNDEKNNKPYAVFLDEGVVNHPDFLHSNRESDATAEDYFPSINKFFENFEKKFNVVVKIAAHPRVDYGELPLIFTNRIEKEKSTIELIKNAKIIFAHASTAISWAVLYKKPIVFITSHVLNNRFQNLISTFSKELKTKLVDMNNNNLLSSLRMYQFIDETSYKRYIELYIKTKGSQEKNTWEIFAEYCKNIKHE